MALKSLNRLSHLRTAAISLRNVWLRARLGIVLGPHVSISLSNRILSRRRGMVFVGSETLIAFKTLIFTYDHRSGRELPVRIGARCFVGGGCMIMPGVTIGDECIVGAGAVVFEDVPDRCIVGGNPARILRREIEVIAFGRLKSADINHSRSPTHKPHPDSGGGEFH